MDNRQANINRFEAEMAKVTRDGVDKPVSYTHLTLPTKLEV